MNNEASYSEFRERAVRYLSEEMGAEERRLFEQEMSGDEEKQRIFNDYRAIWSGVDQLAARGRYDLDAEWELLSGKIDQQEERVQYPGKVTPDADQVQADKYHADQHHADQVYADRYHADQVHAERPDTGLPPVRKLPRRVFVLRIAAALVAGLAGLAGWLVLRNNLSYEQLAVAEGTEVIGLSDGSVVTLNAGSTFKYNLDDPDERKVVLEGEAFFEIAKDPSRPFIIDAGSAVVQVLGTSFNVNAYEENAVVEVTVSTGLVTMSAKHRMENQIILNPGNSGIYDKSEKRLELISSADPNAIAWKTREIMFSETPLGEVVKVIGHVYQTNIQLADASLASCPITVSFNDQELGAVLSVITNTLDLQMERRGDAVVLSGEGCD